MNDIDENATETTTSPTRDAPQAPRFGDLAPRGARTLFTRIIKEDATVPLFLGQTLVNAMRDLGYDDTTSAICEHVDNAIQAGAREIRVYFHETGKRKEKKRIDVLVFDDGVGMAPNVLRLAMAFGGSMSFDNRAGIGRYGMGMKAAALSLSPTLDAYSWQERGAFYNMTLDLKEIGNDRSNTIELPRAELVQVLPLDVREILTSPMVYPKNPADQELLTADADEVTERLGKSGTIIYMPDCDRTTFRTAQTLADVATKAMARIYRRQLDKGLRLYVNNRRVEPFDPTYWMDSARHTRIEGLTEKRSRLVQRWEPLIPIAEDSATKRPVIVRLYLLPIEDWDRLGPKVKKNDLRVFDTGISFMRNDREVDMRQEAAITGKFVSTDSWWRLEIEFPAELDEAFGVAVNKQGVRPKSYVKEILRTTIQQDLGDVRMRIKNFWAHRAADKARSQVVEGERRANDAEALQGTALPRPAPRTEAETASLEEGLRSLAVACKREGETDDEAYARVRDSQYIINMTRDEGPFYRADFRLGKVILTINAGHPFFDKLYNPLTELTRRAVGATSGGEGEPELDAELAASCREALIALQLLLLSLARTQSDMVLNDKSGEVQGIFDRLRKNWSNNLETQLHQQ